jgi:hypothetical protein
LYLLGNDDKRSTWVNGTDVKALAVGKAASVSTFISNGKWQCVSSLSSKWTVGQIYTDPEPAYGSNRPLKGTQYAAVRVDANGNILGVVGTGGDTGSAVGWNSCWASFTGILPDG